MSTVIPFPGRPAFAAGGRPTVDPVLRAQIEVAAQAALDTADRLIAIRRNRLLSLNQATETSYVEQEAVQREIAYARRLFGDQGWPVIDVTRRSIEETAAAIIALCQERRAKA